MALDGAGTRVSARFSTRASDLGFTTPPVPVLLGLAPGLSCGSMFLRSVPPGPGGRLVEWLEPFGLVRLEFGARNVLRADFDPIPSAWADAFRGVDVQMLRLDGDGAASVSVSGERAAVAAFARRLRSRDVNSQHASVRADAPKRRLLTLAQAQALDAAVASGYYEIPRPVNLKQLARELDVSSASLSERLRRAEGRVLTQFVHEGEAMLWSWSEPVDASRDARGAYARDATGRVLIRAGLKAAR